MADIFVSTNYTSKARYTGSNMFKFVWNMEFGVNTKFVLKAFEIQTARFGALQKNLRDCDHHRGPQIFLWNPSSFSFLITKRRRRKKKKKTTKDKQEQKKRIHKKKKQEKEEEEQEKEKQGEEK